MSKEFVYCYHHGLGDLILATPTLRELHKEGFEVTIALRETFESSEILNHCPYIKGCFFCLPAGIKVGREALEKASRQLADSLGISDIKYSYGIGRGHKTLNSAKQLGVKLSSTQTEVFISEQDKKQADELIKKLGLNDYGFIQTTTGSKGMRVPSRDLPKGYGKEWLRRNKNINNFIEIGETFTYDEYNINIQFELMRRAKAVCIPDSVFYHACCAMSKNIDFVFGSHGTIGSRGRVRNLNSRITENKNYSLPDLNK